MPETDDDTFMLVTWLPATATFNIAPFEASNVSVPDVGCGAVPFLWRVKLPKNSCPLGGLGAYWPSASSKLKESVYLTKF